jgi:hypothetical protein
MSRFAVIFGFCTLLAGTQEIIMSRGEHRVPSLIFMSLKHPTHSASLKIFDNTLKCRVKMGQKPKTLKTQKIRYKSVINPL